jgi:hypothetical protein
MRGDNVATLVIQESLFTLMGDSGEDWRFTSIFHYMWTINYKVYNLFIDSGIYKNMMSLEIVRKA